MRLQASNLVCRCSFLPTSTRGFAGARISPNEFGSLHKNDIPIERFKKQHREGNQSFVNQKQSKIISSPVGLSKRIQENMRLEQEYGQPGTSAVLIECSRREFNHHEGFHFPPGMEIPLFSQHWEKNKYKDSWFTIKRRNKNLQSDFSVTANWSSFVPDKLHPLLLQKLIELKFQRPTYIQTQLLQSFASTNHLFLAAETGSGKTLAYALPLVNSILQSKSKQDITKVIIITATGSLKNQTYDFLKKFCDGSPVTVSCTDVKQSPGKNWDILIGTPGLIVEEMKSRSIPKVKNIVMDEADMLLDESFTEVLTDLFALVPISYSETNVANREDGARVIFCSASCPEELECLAEGVVDREKLSYIRSRKLHALLNNLEMKFLRVREMDKINRLTTVLRRDIQLGSQNQTIVFCKDKNTASFVFDELIKSNIDAILWNSGTTAQKADAHRVVVATDLASRGVHLPRLSHVINYDMARHTVDFLHRIGRVGRLRSEFLGRVTSFVRTTPEVKLTNTIELCSRLGRRLPNIETDVSGMIQNRPV